jgi:hypothetical protein
MVTVSRRALFPSWRRSLRQLSVSRLHQIQFRPVGLRLFSIHHANKEFGMIYPGPKTTLPMRGGRI